jgi:hypothetical protein
MDWTALNHALFAHLPVASGLLLPWALLAAQRPGRGIRPWWMVARYLGWMGLAGLLLASVSGLMEARSLGLMPPHRLFPPLVAPSAGPQGLLFRHALLGLLAWPLALLALWSMHRPRKDHQSLGWLALLFGLLWAGVSLLAGRQGHQLAHGSRAMHTPAVPATLPKAPPVPTLTSSTMVPPRMLDYAALEPMHAEPVKSPAHGGRWIRVWVSPEAAQAYRAGQPLPAGAWVVMSTQEDRWGRPGPEVGPIMALEQKVEGPSLSFYWPRIPLEQRKAFGGDSHAYWQGDAPQLQDCRPCHAQGLADSAKRSRWRSARSATPE